MFHGIEEEEHRVKRKSLDVYRELEWLGTYIVWQPLITASIYLLPALHFAHVHHYTTCLLVCRWHSISSTVHTEPLPQCSLST